MNKPQIADSIIKNDLCIGCGLCVYACPSEALKMNWSEYGFLIPEQSNACDSSGDCLTVCPFNPFPEKEVRTENELADIFLENAQRHHPKIGKYNAIYAGYANKYRLTSSSGGIGTFIFTELLANGLVDYVYSVKESKGHNSHYEYAISSSEQELLQASKTKYYPVTLSEVMSEIKNLDGKVAIVGVACFIKAIRLAQYKDPILKEQIPFLVGIICGGIKSNFFSEYLASKMGVEKQNIRNPQFRIKDLKSTAGDYSYGCIDKSNNQKRQIKMRSVGDMWGTGIFKANACDFCDDVTTELADISLGDAWIPPYNKDGQGTSIIVTRSPIADQLIKSGIKNRTLTVEPLELNSFLASQQGSFNHRHLGLWERIKQAQKNKLLTPPKRTVEDKITIDFKIVQKLRMKVRRKSLESWKISPNAIDFDRDMKTSLTKLRKATQINHLRKKIMKRVNIILGNRTI
ncbi:Coenzyme F420 hydrogenase/dehydrogenase, beta subunit C-terminal domain [Draconibacterium orientale]|uniref:Coenzyme F420 hydrogenase/dehydrogenase, beta subunit C-terminal domain n=1 Tax=Draconibacterium orientale TaxID=1168034 RepID=UPI002ABE913F|nr:Coenzyme F420 hydrogenase/dehydrogenase, beta subunit C-terminal domain [Draconibacterium orientale]